jgi:uncharacterized FlaG/YvyC family protein
MNLTSVAHPAQQVQAPAEPTHAAPPSQQQRSVIRAVTTVNTAEVFGPDNEVTYQMDRKAHQIVVRVVNRKSGQVINQIPQEYLLRMAEKINGS